MCVCQFTPLSYSHLLVLPASFRMLCFKYGSYGSPSLLLLLVHLPIPPLSCSSPNPSQRNDERLVHDERHVARKDTLLPFFSSLLAPGKLIASWGYHISVLCTFIYYTL